MKRDTSTRYVAYAAIIAALYVVLTYAAALLGLSSGVIQIRFSEALTILPAFTPAAIPGLFIGCLLSNLLTGCVIWDTIFGSLATLLGAIGTWLLRNKLIHGKPLLAPFPPIIANTLIIPFILSFAYFAEEGIPFLMLTVGAGEVISCGVLGTLLLLALHKHKKILF